MSNRIVTRYASLLLAAFVFGCSDDGPTGVDTLPFEVTPISVAVDQGSTRQLTLTGIANADVTWETTNAAKATVSSTGLVTGVDSGFVAISARSKADPSLLSSATVQVIALQGIALTSGVPVTGVSSSGARFSLILYRIFVPTGTTRLTVTLAGGTGDVDLYVRRQSPPTISSTGASVADCRSENAANNETCVISNPASGTWYVGLGLWDPYAGVTVTATRTP